MVEEPDGPGVARARIAEEAERRTGDLDLGGLGLTQLPPELFELRHLRRLNLGFGIGIKEKEKLGQVGGASGVPNRIDGQFGSIGLLSVPFGPASMPRGAASRPSKRPFRSAALSPPHVGEFTVGVR